jgi:DNA-binding transcriptional regulator YdaS (Cro superfamily)
MAELARRLGKTRGAVNQWKQRVPAEMCPAIERITGVKCEALRPDVEWTVLRGKPPVDAPCAGDFTIVRRPEDRRSEPRGTPDRRKGDHAE